MRRIPFALIVFALISVTFASCSKVLSPTNSPAEIINPVGYATHTPRSTIPPIDTNTPLVASTDYEFSQSFIDDAASKCKDAFTQDVQSLPAEGPVYIMVIDSSISSDIWKPADEDLKHPLVEANSAEDVFTLVCVKQSERRVGTYTDGSAAFRKYLEARLVRWEDEQVVGQKSFTGGSPPATKSGGGFGYGTLPVNEYRNWLVSLFVKDNLFVDYPPVRSLVFSPDDKFLVMIGGDLSLKVWDVSEEKVVYSQIGYSTGGSQPVPIAFSSDSKLLALHNRSGLSILNTETWETVSELASADVGQMYSASFSSDGRLMAIGGYLGVMVFHSQDMVEVSDYPIFYKVNHVIITPDDKYLVAGVYSCDSCGKDKGLFVWDLQSNSLMSSQEDYVINDIALLSDGKTVALATAGDNQIWLYDLATASVANYLAGHTSIVEKLSLSSDGKWLISVDQENKINVWDMQTLQLYKNLPAAENIVSAIALSKNGNLAAIGSSEDGVVNFLEVN